MLGERRNFSQPGIKACPIMKLMSSSSALMQLATHAEDYHRCQCHRQKPSKIVTLLIQLIPRFMDQCKLENSSLDIPDNAVSSVGSKDDNGGNRRFQSSVQVCETLNIQHVNLIHKEHTWH